MAKATGPTYKVAFRRRRENATNYAKRLALVKGGKPRMVVRKTLRGVLVQFFGFSEKGDNVLAAVNSRALRGYGWAPRCNSPTAYLCGLLAGKLAAGKGVSEFNLDIGMNTPSKGAVVFAAMKGAVDSGLKTAHDAGIVDEGRITGSAIGEYAKSLKSSDEARYRKVFSAYLKENFDPERIADAFRAAKERISAANAGKTDGE